uniref:Uncharacterized protein n=1 Tax=Anguilla anguilla TaxID=7936 RepID=A0A0E9S6V9_ANGAN
MGISLPVRVCACWVRVCVYVCVHLL